MVNDKEKEPIVIFEFCIDTQQFEKIIIENSSKMLPKWVKDTLKELI
jgi:hypothetical protein